MTRSSDSTMSTHTRALLVAASVLGYAYCLFDGLPLLWRAGHAWTAVAIAVAVANTMVAPVARHLEAR